VEVHRVIRKKIERGDEVILQFFISYCILIVEFRFGEFEEFCSWFSVSGPWVPVYPGSPSLGKRKNTKTVQQTYQRYGQSVSFYHQI
jgi:hypothetical protein